MEETVNRTKSGDRDGFLNPFPLSKSLPRRERKKKKRKIVKHFLTGKRYPPHPLLLASVSVDVFVARTGSSRGPRRGGKSVEKHESASYAVHLVLVAIHQTSAIAVFFFFSLSSSLPPSPSSAPKSLCSLVVGAGQLSFLSSSAPSLRSCGD